VRVYEVKKEGKKERRKGGGGGVIITEASAECGAGVTIFGD